ncbi:P63C domain-containing protein [Burkholderia cenocepacia]|uniref:P63C domain-containing protein n=1 Tax=Burkholderia cenocepacia TaxID=95486 RepID=UPI00196B74C8|nr:P63C domain-containing protein [Burkholderia cenocepacia]MBN3571319.1 P63C domain-containing protein [Burkholderia cenocepacia]MBR8114331.1 P63C domain-containing protein [Burkholderia cenocepacia]MBR8380541.1 P63C domain-containing protein [Burkholderia cenocepacia]
MTTNTKGKAAGGIARAESLSPEKRKEIATKAAQAKKELASLPWATHGSADHPLKIGAVEIPCYVLEDGTRVLSQRGVVGGLGMKYGSRASGADRLTGFLEGKAISPFVNKELMALIGNPIKFRVSTGGGAVFGYPATVLADICDVVLAARAEGVLQKQQEHIAAQAEILVRGFARVGIIALVDEATGYQRDRAANSLAKILEAFIAKELQPWVRTFPADYYEQLFRLRGLDYQKDTPKRPQYFGVLTNDIVYRRLAPGVLDELKRVSKGENGRPKHKLFQKLTQNIGYPKLREHLGSVVTLMKLSDNYRDFIQKLDKIHPPYGKTMQLPFDDSEDDGKGI